MPINKNHEFEDLEGTKCAIVERNANAERVEFLKDLLSLNGYTVVVVPSPPPKAAKPAAPATGEPAMENPETPSGPSTFTVGVTDVTFNAVNAVFGRLLRTRDNKVVTLAYWQQKDSVADEGTPYFMRR